MIWWALVFHVLKIVSMLFIFRLFIYEETCQAGGLALFCATAGRYKLPTGKIIELTKKHGLLPGQRAIREHWVLAPPAVKPFEIFFEATERLLEASQ